MRNISLENKTIQSIDASSRRRFGIRTAVVAAAGITLASVASPAGAADATLACDPGFYQVIAGQLAALDPGSETYHEIGSDGPNYNAMGYRVADGYLYGISGRTLHRIDATGARTDLATLDIPNGAYTGDFDDAGLLNVSRGGRGWYRIDVEAFSAEFIPEFDGYTAVADVTNVHGIFYGVSSDGTLYSYDQTSLDVREVGAVAGLPATLKAYGAAWATAGGNLYVGRNSGEIYQITGYTTTSPQATQVGRAPSTSSNDGASCAFAAPAAGLDDVDGPVSESPPRTPLAQDAADRYEEDYDDISQTFSPAEPAAEPEPEPEPTGNDDSYAIGDAGLGTGPSCSPGEDVDRPARDAVGTSLVVDQPKVVFGPDVGAGSLDAFTIMSGSWTAEDSSLVQNNFCGYDYTALLEGFTTRDFRWEATFAGVSDTNQGGLILHHASTRSRSGAVVVDLTDGGATLRWGEYDNLGYYRSIGSVPVAAPSAGQSVSLAVEVHGTTISVFHNGGQAAVFESTESSGMVGLISSLSQVAFSAVTLTALPVGAP